MAQIDTFHTYPIKIMICFLKKTFAHYQSENLSQLKFHSDVYMNKKVGNFHKGVVSTHKFPTLFYEAVSYTFLLLSC